MPARKAAQAPRTPAELQRAVNKRFGVGTVLRGSDPSLKVVRIPTGILSIDFLTQGGFPRNRHIEIFGSANVGKTYATYRLIGSAQKLGLNAAMADVEGTFDPVFAEHAGVDLDNLYMVPQKEHGNQIVDVMEAYLRSGMYDVFVLDSIAALLPKEEREKPMDSGSFGAEQAKLMSKAMRKLTAANKTTCIVYINQTRDAIGSIFGPKQTTSGGRAMSFYAGLRLEFVRTEQIKRPSKVIDTKTGEAKKQDIIVGHRVLVRTDKNKTGGAKIGEQTTFVFNYELNGIDPIEDLIYVATRLGWVHRKASGNTQTWWLEEYENHKQRGRNAFKKWLRGNPEIVAELTEWINNVEFEEEGEVED